MPSHETLRARINALQQGMGPLALDAVILCDRENLIYFTGVCDLEGAALAVPSRGAPQLFCHALDAAHVREKSGLDDVRPYAFPQQNKSMCMAQWLLAQGISRPAVGFTRYFINLKDYQCLRTAMPDMTVCDAADICYRLRSVKSAEEIQYIAQAATFLSAGMDAALDAAKPGAKETEVLAEAEYAMRKAGSEGASFRMQVLTSARQQMLHPYAGDNALQNNAPVVVHLGASFKGYTAKMCRTVFLGSPAKESVAVYEALRAAQDAVSQALRPGVTCDWLYAVARDVVASYGLAHSWRLKEIGYGVGIRQSEFYPVLSEGNTTVIEENMVVDFLLGTLYGPHGGPRLTDTVLVTAHGCRRLTQYTRETLYR